MSIISKHVTSDVVKRRQRIEHAIARRLVRTLLECGYSLGVYDGEEITIERCKSSRAIMQALGTSDEDYLLVYDTSTPDDYGNDLSAGWFHLVYGNCGHDLISNMSGYGDYFERLQKETAFVDAYAATFDK